MSGIFITATDTGAGKTIITGLLARYLLEKGYTVITQKWIQTGCKEFMSTDAGQHLKIMGLEKNNIKDYLNYVLPYAFKTAASPYLAGSIENKRINPDKIIKSYRILCREFDFVIAEGIGGALVPINRKQLVIDMVKQLDMPVLIVALNKLGAINHTLLTIEALRRRNIKILGIVFNNPQKEDARIVKDNPRIISALTKEDVLGVLSWIEKSERLYERFIPIGKKICYKLKIM